MITSMLGANGLVVLAPKQRVTAGDSVTVQLVGEPEKQLALLDSAEEPHQPAGRCPGCYWRQRGVCENRQTLR